MQTLTEEYVASLTKWQVLSLDCAEHMGYYSCHGYGTVHFPNTEKAPKKFGPDYQQHKAFREWVKDFVKEHGIKLVVAEDVNVGTQFMALRKLSQFQGVLYEICATLNVPLIVCNVRSLKSFATGNGNASKQMMIEYARKRWKIDPQDDNAADAAHLFFYIIKRYNIQ